MTDKTIKYLACQCRWLAIVCIVSAVIPLYFLRNVTIDNSIEVWLEKDSREFSEYRSFLEKYGNEEFIVAAAVVDDPLSEKWLSTQKTIGAQLKQIEHVQNVLDLSSVAEPLSRYVPEWKSTLKNNSFFKNLLLGRNDHVSGMIVWLKKIDNPSARRLTVEKIESVFDNAAWHTKFSLAGTPLMNVALDRGSQKAAMTFLPIALAMSVVILFVALRSISGIMAVICAVAVTTIWTLGLLAVCGKTLNMLTVVLPSLLFILSLSSGIHICDRYFGFRATTENRPDAMQKTLKEVLLPIFLSNITTSVGFASLIVSDMQPVIDFGIFAAIGMLISFVFSLMIVPGILLLFSQKTIKTNTVDSHWTSRIGLSMFNHKVPVIAVSMAALLVSVGLTAKSTVESNVLKFFPENARISHDYDFIGNNLTGFYTIELDLTSDSANSGNLFKKMTLLGQTIEARPEAAKVLHYGKTASVLKELAGTTPLPLACFTDENPFRQMSRHYLITENGKTSMRMSVFVRAMSSKDFDCLLDFIRQQADSAIGNSAVVTVTGIVPLLNAAQQSLIDTQVRSFATATAVVLGLMAIFMKSFRTLIAAILPNILPVFSLFAIMAVLHIPLDAATVMIASVAIGIAVDDTIHFLTCYRAEKFSGKTMKDAIAASYNTVGRANTFTSIVAAAGFAVLCMAQFRPIQYFGLLTSITMIMAWACDVFILPACIAFAGLWEKNDTTAK